jgi:hypothetical protein
MKSKDGFVQAYNGQLAVDAQSQVIVAQDVTQSPVDSGQLLPMADAVEANLGPKPAQASADSGYCSEANLAGLEEREIDGYVATGRARDAVAGAAQETAPEAAQGETAPAAAGAAAPATGPAQEAKAPTRVEVMRTKIKSGGHASPYRLRKQVVGPVFGQIKQAPRLPPVPAARHREGARRMGLGLHRPQPAEAGSEVESVRRDADAAESQARGRVRPLLAAFHAQSCRSAPRQAPTPT